MRQLVQLVMVWAAAAVFGLGFWSDAHAAAGSGDRYFDVEFLAEPLYTIDSRPAAREGDLLAGLITKDRRFVRSHLFGDRYTYYADEPVASFFALLLVPDSGTDGMSLAIELRDGAGKPIDRFESKAESGQAMFRLNIADLDPGKYEVVAALVSKRDNAIDLATQHAAGWSFEKVAKTHEAVDLPSDGIPIELESQDVMQTGSWPIETGVPLPRGKVSEADIAKFVLLEDDKPVASQLTPVGTWEPNGSIKWAHLRFVGRYKSGEAATYRLKLMDRADQQQGVKVSASAETIEVDTGAVKFSVSRAQFAGPEQVQFDPTAKGNYSNAIINAGQNAGGYLVDAAGKRYEAKADGDVEVTVDHAGPALAVIAASGWYVDKASGDRLCKFVTRMTAAAGLPMIRVTQQTYITFDPHVVQLADLGFDIPVDGATSFSLGVDGKTIEGDLPAGDASAFMHQDSWDHCRVVGLGETREGEKSDGWMRATKGNTHITVALRDVWQKFPKELEASRSGMTVHFWPEHGHDTFTQEQELAKNQIYKFLTFHEGKLMDLKTPKAYVDWFSTYAEDPASHSEGSHNWWRESEHDGTEQGKPQGAVISNEFAIQFTAAKTDEQQQLPHDAGTFAKLLQVDPFAAPSPTWNTAVDAMAKMAAVDGETYPQMEQAVHDGFLSWAASVERNNDYGMFNYADTHTIWKVAENRPGLHRVWQGSHYHNMSTNWLQYHRSGSPRMLRWARANTDHYMNIDTINYVDRDNPIDVRDHQLGAMQHMGWKTHWASSRSDGAWGSFGGVTGHFIDPDGLLWSWQVTANPKAKESYDFWHESVVQAAPGQLYAYARNSNTTLAYLINLYETKWDARLLPAIHTMGKTLRSVPLETQRPGPLWHPWWINRYYELSRDTEYVDWILHFGDREHAIGYPWPLALSALAYEISGDQKYLTQMYPLIATFPYGYYREEGHAYDWFGKGPGPLGGRYAYLSWGRWLDAAKAAGVKPDSLDPYVLTSAGGYPFQAGRFDHFGTPPSVIVWSLEQEDGPVTLNLGLKAMGGSLHAISSRTENPAGEIVNQIKRIGEAPDENKPVHIDADGKTGLYRTSFRSHEALVPIPQTNLPYEAAAMLLSYGDVDRVAKFRWTNTYLKPTFPYVKYRFKIRSIIEDGSIHFILRDANGKEMASGYLMSELEDRAEQQLVLNPRKSPVPWHLVILGGKSTISFKAIPEAAPGPRDVILFARSPEDLSKVEAAMREEGHLDPNE